MIKIGNLEIDKFYLGDKSDAKIYLGDVKVWPEEATYDFKLHYATSGGSEVTINCDESWEQPLRSVLPTINLLEIGDCTTAIPKSGFTIKGGTTSKPKYYGLQICPKFTMSDSVTKIDDYGMKASRYTTEYIPTLEESVLSKNITYIGQYGLSDWKFGDISFPNNFSGYSYSFWDITASTITIGENAYLVGYTFSSVSANTITIGDGFNNPTKVGLFASVSANTINIGNGTLEIRSGGCFQFDCVIQNLNINSNYNTRYPLFEKNRGTIKNVTYGNDVTVIGENVFSGRTELSSVVIGNSVTSIGSSAFDSCRSLTSLVIPSNISSINNYAFNRCTGLISITVHSVTPPTLGYGVFDSTNNCPIYVPPESVDTYKAASNWSSYASRIQAIPT